jgi:uncharacterized protein YabE (DUF348 family)
VFELVWQKKKPKKELVIDDGKGGKKELFFFVGDGNGESIDKLLF